MIHFDFVQVGGERFNFFSGVPKSKTCTIILRGGAEQFMAETERSLHDAIMIVRRWGTLSKSYNFINVLIFIIHKLDWKTLAPTPPTP